MSKDTILFVCGIAVAVLPFLGFPQSWRTWMFVILGGAIAIVAVSLRREFMMRDRRAQSLRGDVFVQNGIHGRETPH